MKFAEALTQALVELKVKHVFGVSGANIEYLHDAIHRNTQLSSVLAKTEIGAAYMADASARSKGKLAVCCSTSGAGMMNLLVGLAESYAENVPILAIVGQMDSSLNGKGGFQDSSALSGNVDGFKLLSACTKSVINLTDTTNFWDDFSWLITQALTGQPGPVALMVPREIFQSDIMPLPSHWIDDIPDPLSLNPPAEYEVTELLAMLTKANKPLLIMGAQASRSPSLEHIQAFAERTKLPVATSMSGKGAYDHFAINFIGNNGIAGHESVNTWVQQADLIIVAGCRLDVMNRGHVLDAAKSGTRVIAINISPPFELNSLENLCYFNSEPGQFFEQVMHQIDGANSLYTGQYPSLIPFPFKPVNIDPTFSDGLSFSLAMKAINPFIDIGDQIFIDAGNTGATALHYLQLPQDSQSHIALGMGGMGYSFAAAIGHQISNPTHDHTLVFAGDGSFLMGGLEIHGAIERQLPILFFIFNDAGHGMCKTRQRVFFNNRFEAVAYPELDISRLVSGLAEPTQLFCRQVCTEQELVAAMTLFKAGNVPTGVIEIKINREEWPPFTTLPSIQTNNDTEQKLANPI
ncbi:thiamine pyrophosphate-binding protein [Shewanella sp.]|uniref:thiamine pyrophosphate-binding protein n=1 Tax=Shewanella sp. TaxID=50422 RepID=UPI002586E806|nr:thiamine pyrophosphate-binding protein [Shewanella sp.]MCJ8302066.1 thiamine pyrophosphate-binding protein [Shewanella sp.]